MPTQLLHETDDGGQDFFGTALFEILLQDYLPPKVPIVPPLEVQHILLQQKLKRL